MNTIKNVIAVDRIPCSEIPGLTRNSNGTFSVDVKDDKWEKLEIQVPAKLSVNNKVDNKNTVWNTQLVFRTCQDLEVNGHYAYRITLANGQKRLIGGHERPYPVTVPEENLPDNMSDSQLLEVTVTLSSGSRLPVIT